LFSCLFTVGFLVEKSIVPDITQMDTGVVIASPLGGNLLPPTLLSAIYKLFSLNPGGEAQMGGYVPLPWRLD